MTVRQMGSVLAALPIKARAERNLQEGKPLDQWDTLELMALLPEKAKDCEPADLDLVQLCLMTQHVLNNCKRHEPGVYDHALNESYLPELLRRMMKDLSEGIAKRDALSTFRIAWELYRSGAATLEEVAPLLDEALGDPMPKMRGPEGGTEKPVAPFTSVVGQGNKPQIGALVTVNRVRYRVVAHNGKNVKLRKHELLEQAELKNPWFWAEWK